MPEFRVWAPRPDVVELVLADRRLPMDAEEGGWWSTEADTAPDATYGFSLDGGPPLPDPRGRALPEGPHGPSRLFDDGSFTWTDQDWAGTDLDGAVIYELHVGTYSPEGTLDAAATRLDHLVDLGITMVELLPMAPVPGQHGWGYDGVAPFAVHEPYGGPAALQRFVDAAHARGLGVCLDVVHNHLGPDGNYLPAYGPYLTNRYATPWGAAINLDGPGSDEVRAYLLDSTEQWFREFHVDALRLDAVHELIDNRAVTFLEELGARTDALAAELGRPLTLIAETDRNDPRTVTPREAGGLGLHAQWADDVHHALHVVLTGETQGYYADFADPAALALVLGSPFFHDGGWSSFRGRSHGRPVDLARTPGRRFVAALQTHDQIGNRAVGDRLGASLGIDRLACGAAILLTGPWTPMLFMGEEWGATTPWAFFTDHTDAAVGAATGEGRRAEFAAHGWDEADVPDPQDPRTFADSKLDWEEPTRDGHDRLLRWYRDLIRLRRTTDDLRADGPEDTMVEHDPTTGRFVLRRGGHTVLVNLGATEQEFDVSGDVVLSWSGSAPAGGRLVLPGNDAAVVRS